MRAPKNIRAIEKAGPDMMGFICWENSCRYVDEVPTYLPQCIRVGVFVNPSSEYVVRKTNELQLTQYESVADMFLFDTKCKSIGGSGEQFNWDILNHYQGNIPFLLAGGIGLEDVDRLFTWHHPMWIGIDINSRFEEAPAMKNVEVITQFIKQIRSHE